MDSILEVKNIYFSYHTKDGETPALKKVSFDIKEGEFIAIVGPSGCGKSTLLHLIAGLLKPEEGIITYRGNMIPGGSANLGYMLQRDELLEWRSIYANIILGLEIQHKLTSENKARVWHFLSTYGLKSFAYSHPSELSGGMRQRAALIRTLVLNPDILLLDEPFSALDYQTRLTVSDDIGKIIRNERKSAILVTHDLSEAISLADRIIILSERPAIVHQTVRITFSHPDLSPLERRNAPEFKTYFNLIWKELNHSE